MGISKDRSSEVKKIRHEYMYIKSNIDRFVDMRSRLGRTHSQALVELINQIKNRNYNVFHNVSLPGNTLLSSVPSMGAIKHAIKQLYNSAERLGNVGLGSPHSPDPRDFRRGLRRTDLGNAIRNLEPLFSGVSRSADCLRDEENRRSWRNESLDRIRMLREDLDHRSAIAKGETLTGNRKEVESKARREKVRAKGKEDGDEAKISSVTETRTRKVEVRARKKEARVETEVTSLTEARDATEVTSVTESRAKKREAMTRAKARRETEDKVGRESQVQPKISDYLHDAAIPAYQYDPLTFNPNELTFSQSLNVMSHFDFDMHYEKIRTTIVSFSLKIYGMDLCEYKDLQLAVYFFIEEHFNLKTTIKMCVRSIEDVNRQNVVGVLFEKIETVNHIIENRAALDNTQLSVVRNYDSKWIVMNYKNDDSD